MNMNAVSIIQQVAGHPVGVPPQLLAPPPPPEGSISEVPPPNRSCPPSPPPQISLPTDHEDAVTLPCGSDRYPGTIIDRPNKKTIVVRRDTFKQTSGDPTVESQKYDFFPDEDGTVQTYTLRKNGGWTLKGDKQGSHNYAVLGQRRAYQDPGF